MVSVKRRKASWPRLRADKGESWSAHMGSRGLGTASSAWPAAVTRARFQTGWPVALTDKRASAKFEFPRFSIFHILKSKTEVFVMSKIGETF
jgi:hypothetical protein